MKQVALILRGAFCLADYDELEVSRCGRGSGMRSHVPMCQKIQYPGRCKNTGIDEACVRRVRFRTTTSCSRST